MYLLKVNKIVFKDIINFAAVGIIRFITVMCGYNTEILTTPRIHINMAELKYEPC